MRAVEQGTLASVRVTASQLAEDAARYVWLLVGLLMVTVAGVVTCASWIVRKLLTSMHRVEHVLDRLGEGDLTNRVDVVGSDEIAHMGHSLNRALDSFVAALSRIRGTATELNASAGDLSTVAVGLKHAADGSASQATSAATAAGQVSADVESVASASAQLGASIGQIAESPTTRRRSPRKPSRCPLRRAAPSASWARRVSGLGTS